jgi:hypothetical protein
MKNIFVAFLNIAIAKLHAVDPSQLLPEGLFLYFYPLFVEDLHKLAQSLQGCGIVCYGPPGYTFVVD